jgi:uncharacterized membrane protein
MDKHTFLYTLAKYLDVPATEKEEILNEYETHFIDALALGRSEQEVIAQLGDPKFLAFSFSSAKQISIVETKPNIKNSFSLFTKMLGLGSLKLILLFPLWLVLISIIFSLLVSGLAIGASGIIGFIIYLFQGNAQILFSSLSFINTILLLVSLILIGIGLVPVGLKWQIWSFKLPLGLLKKGNKQ